MLKTPSYGWSEITIGDWHDRCSYLDDVPYRLLEAVDYTNRTNRPSTVKFDAEGWEYIIVFDSYAIHIICYDFYGKNNYYTFDISIKDATRELINDIRRDIDAWSQWPYDITDDDEIAERKLDLGAWCDVIEKRL